MHYYYIAYSIGYACKCVCNLVNVLTGCIGCWNKASGTLEMDRILLQMLKRLVAKCLLSECKSVLLHSHPSRRQTANRRIHAQRKPQTYHIHVYSSISYSTYGNRDRLKHSLDRRRKIIQNTKHQKAVANHRRVRTQCRTCIDLVQKCY